MVSGSERTLGIEHFLMETAMKSRLTAVAIILFLLLPFQAQAANGSRNLELVDHVGKDPMLVVVVRTESLLEPIQGLIDTVAGMDSDFQPETAEQAFAELEAELGFPLRDELLSQLGPEFGFVLSVPPMDTIMARIEEFPASLPDLMDGTGFMASVRNADMVDRSLRKLLVFEEKAEIIDGDDGLVRVRYATPSGNGEPGQIDICFGIRNGWLAIGMSPGWVQGALSDAAPGNRLSDGDDYRKVFANLDSDPSMLGYVNLPALMTWIQESDMLKMILSADPEASMVMNMFLNEEYMNVGLGYTSVEMNGGVRTSTFGPAGLTGPGMYTGMVAAIAIPNLLNAIDRGKQKRTMADMSSIATAMESYAIDNNSYPATEGWQPAGVLKGALEPVYIRTLPQVDGWENRILVLSDGTNYTIVSQGKDGALDGDWAGEFATGPTTAFTHDIVFQNGQFAKWPEGAQQ
jgi:general secretion pathway protein G